MLTAISSGVTADIEADGRMDMRELSVRVPSLAVARRGDYGAADEPGAGDRAVQAPSPHRDRSYVRVTTTTYALWRCVRPSLSECSVTTSRRSETARGSRILAIVHDVDSEANVVREIKEEPHMSGTDHHSGDGSPVRCTHLAPQMRASLTPDRRRARRDARRPVMIDASRALLKASLKQPLNRPNEPSIAKDQHLGTNAEASAGRRNNSDAAGSPRSSANDGRGLLIHL
jgi:hypothetical protein